MAPGLLERRQDVLTATIYALSSGRPPAGVAVVRISGPRALAALAALAGRVPPARRARLARLTDPASGGALDDALVLAFPGPASATGEDVAELHLHGGPAVVAAVLGALGRMEGLRLAEPGEFTRRAFENGRIDLSRAEGLADLVAAETEGQRRAALAQAGGRLAGAADRWRSAIVALRADAEAELDFAEEEADVAAGLAAESPALAALRAEIAAALADAGRGERLREGLTIAVTGPPNVGKSSLVNALARSDVAIVSPHAGTTRDAIEVRLDLGGVAVTLVDTAGLRETADPVEAEGVRRARARAAAADLVLRLFDGEDPGGAGQAVRTKTDLDGTPPGVRAGVLHLSAATGAGMAEAEAWLAEWAAQAVRPDEPVLVTRERHRGALAAGLEALDLAAEEQDPVLRAEALRRAARAMERITGRVDVEDLLDSIFARFCIGK